MEKKKLNDNDLKGFLLNFLAVVLGIVITFCGEGLIENRNEKKEVKKSLELVKNELNDNIGYISIADSMLINYASSARFILRYLGRISEAPEDTLNMYGNYPLTAIDVDMSEEALDLLKTSSLFTKIKDQQLSLDIIHTYGAIRDRMTLYKMIFEQCNDYRNEAITDKVKAILAKDNITQKMLWEAITSSTEGIQFLRELTKCEIYSDSSELKELIASTCAKIDNYK